MRANQGEPAPRGVSPEVLEESEELFTKHAGEDRASVNVKWCRIDRRRRRGLHGRSTDLDPAMRYWVAFLRVPPFLALPFKRPRAIRVQQEASRLLLWASHFGNGGGLGNFQPASDILMMEVQFTLELSLQM
jgi:hypothetical protein